MGEHIECAACGRSVTGEYSIHRDGFDEGPEVRICDNCGSGEKPTCATLWRRIAKRRALKREVLP